MTARTAVRPRVSGIARDEGSWGAAGAFVLPLIAIIAVAAASGGFNATSFGWTALAFSWVVIAAVAITAPTWAALDIAWLVAALAVCLFTFLSAAWSGSVGTAIDNGQRSLEYLLGLVAALLIARRGRLSLWLGGAALGAAAISVYSLATRLFPNRFGAFNASAGYRLFVPIGYWNALGVFAVLGALIAFGVSVEGRGRALRILAGAALVPLSATLYFTFSRGAWGALGVGLLTALVFSTRRLRLLAGALVLGALPAVGVVLASRSSGLTHQSVVLSAAAHAGHRLAPELVLLLVTQAVVAAVYVVWLSRLKVADSWRRVAGAAAIGVLVGVLAAIFVGYGSPPTLARDAYDSFVSAPTGGSDLNSRLFSLSNNGRTVLWRSALDDFEAHPVAGSGAGSFGRWWLAHRTSAYFVEDAHNLYAQTLAEGGVIGFALLLGLLGVPLIAAIRARRSPLAAPALGAYVAFLVHAAVDWDWQVPAVTLLALFAGAALVAAARGDAPRVVPAGVRAAIGGVAALAAAIAFVGLVGNIAIGRAENAILNGFDRQAIADASKAHRWAPWSAQALRDLGEARVLAGQRQAGIAALRQSAAKDPGDWRTWYDIAVVTTGPDRHAALVRARKLNPEGPELTAFGQSP